MKKILSACLLTFFIAHNLFAQRVNSSVNSVTVYLQGAMVSRSVQMNLTPGTNEIIIEGLSNFVDDKSIVLEGTGSANATILSVDYRINPLKYQEEDEVGKAMKKTLDSLKQKLSFVQNERFGYEQELLVLQENHKLTIKGVFIDDLDEAAEFIRKRNIEIRNKLTGIALIETDLQTKVNDVQTQFNQRGNSYRAQSGEIVVRLNSTSYGKADFSLKYYVTTAGWSPSYSLRVDDMGQPINLNYDAVVWQRTGEQWKNVKLTLTTSTPSVIGSQPSFAIQYIDFYRGNYGYDTKGGRSNSNVYYQDGIKMPPSNAKVEEKYKVDNTSNYTTVVNNPVNVNFEIGPRYDIPSDGTTRYIRVQQSSIPATFEHSALPRLEKSAYLTARLTNWEDQNLLPGPASLFIENTYVGKTYIDPNAAVDTLTLYFGKDNQVIVDRTKVKTSSKKQFLGSSKVETFEYIVTVRNAKNRPVTITVTDQIPVSTNKDIEVTLKDAGKAQYDEATGKLTWQITLQPSESKAFQFQYSVKYPKNSVVSGLY